MNPMLARPWRNAASLGPKKAREPLRRYPMTGKTGRCARTIAGHAAATPPSPAMNSRRRIPSSPEAALWIAYRDRGCMGTDRVFDTDRVFGPRRRSSDLLQRGTRHVVFVLQRISDAGES